MLPRSVVSSHRSAKAYCIIASYFLVVSSSAAARAAWSFHVLTMMLFVDTKQ